MQKKDNLYLQADPYLSYPTSTFLNTWDEGTIHGMGQSNGIERRESEKSEEVEGQPR